MSRICDNSNTLSKEQADKGSLLYVFIISSVAAIGGLLFGFDVGVIAGAIPFITDHFQLNAHQEGFAVSNIIIGCVIGSAVSGPLSDHYGRKKVLIMVFIGLLFNVSSGDTVWVIVPVLAFVAFYAMSLGPVAWVIVAEIFPTKIRGRAMAISMVVLWLSDFSVSQTFPWLMEHIEEKTFYIYAVINVIGFLFAWFVVKETKGRSLEEIEKMWSA